MYLFCIYVGVLLIFFMLMYMVVVEVLDLLVVNISSVYSGIVFLFKGFDK